MRWVTSPPRAAWGRGDRWIATASLGEAWLISRDALVLVLLVIAAVQAWRLRDRSDPPADRIPLLQYVGLALVLSAIIAFSATGLARP